ncbi:hypothetical protein M5D96_006431 [Drosophila gunungcola]|uniref:Uncharacterized protein n=1 Tax=Drosophila gunungcola TaxID=103775 RepID=A0A9P9YNZ4_9MUSC|nr:hypothetical protein M5D96_006431 [Drosophila gunungcola]
MHYIDTKYYKIKRASQVEFALIFTEYLYFLINKCKNRSNHEQLSSFQC